MQTLVLYLMFRDNREDTNERKTRRINKFVLPTKRREKTLTIRVSKSQKVASDSNTDEEQSEESKITSSPDESHSRTFV